MRTCVLPKLNYFSRIFPPDVLAPAAKFFDSLVCNTFCAKHLLPTLDSEAREQLSWPTILGGFGLRSIQQVSPYSFFSASSQYFHRISPLVPSPDSLSSLSTVPFVQSIRKCHRFLLDLKAKLPSPFPPHPDQFFTDFHLNPSSKGFQASLLKTFYKQRVKLSINRSLASSAQRARLSSLEHNSSSFWLSTPPISPSYILPNPIWNSCIRMRLGLGPFDMIRHCSCGTSLNSFPLPFLTCTLLRSSTTARHDLIFQSLAKAARLCGIAVQSEPSLAIGLEGSRSDGKFFFPSLEAHVDVSVVHPAAPAYLRLKAGAAIKKRESEKNSHYLEAAKRQGAEFFALVFDSFGGFGGATLH